MNQTSLPIVVFASLLGVVLLGLVDHCSPLFPRPPLQNPVTVAADAGGQ